MKKIQSIYYIPVSEIKRFDADLESVKIETYSDFRKIEVTRDKSAPVSNPKIDDAGTIYAISITQKLLHCSLTLLEACRLGCVIRAITADGQSYIYGCVDFPLFGTIRRNVAGTAKDFAGYTLSLSGSQRHDELLLRE